MFAPTGTSKRSRIEINLTNFCFSRPALISRIHPTPYRARPDWERRWTDWKWRRNPDTALYLVKDTPGNCSLFGEVCEDSRMKRRKHRQGSKPASPPTPTIPSGVEKPASPSVALAGADRRTHPRYEFIAAVEVVAAESGARIETRVRDLSQQGCYVDTNNPLPLGTVTDVRITKGAQLFEAHGRVVYSRASKGMGLVFTDIEP